MSGQKIPAPKPAPPPPVDPTANEDAKAAAASAKVNESRRLRSGSMGSTLATSPEGVLGAAPTNTPGLKSTLGA